MSVLALLLLLAGTAGLVFVEIKLLGGKWYSPFCLLSVPYAFASVCMFILSEVYGFEKMKLRFSLIVLFYLVLTLAFEFLLKKVFTKRISFIDDVHEQDTGRWLDIVSLLIPSVCLIWFVVLAAGLPTFGMIVQEEFQGRYAGDMYFLRLMCIILGAYQASRCRSFKDKRLLCCLLLILPNFLTFVKGIVIISIISDVVAFAIANKIKLSWKPVVIVGCFGMAVFYGIYLIEHCVWDIKAIIYPETHKLIFFKIISYLSSGLESFNINIDHTYRYATVENVVIAPYANCLAQLGLTERTETVTSVHTIIGSIEGFGDIRVNTHSYFGALYLYCGLFLGIAPHFINYFMAYFLYSRIKHERLIFTVAYAVFTSGFVLSWFDYYYLHTFWGYMLVMAALIAFAFPVWGAVRRFIDKRKA